VEKEQKKGGVKGRGGRARGKRQKSLFTRSCKGGGVEVLGTGSGSRSIVPGKSNRVGWKGKIDSAGGRGNRRLG